MRKLLKFSLYSLCALLLFSSCKKERSSTTGWGYNDSEWGGFEKQDYKGQATGPNLVLVEGGTFTMGTTEQDVMFEYDNVPRRVTVSSFYMDETEVANIDYREYLYWLKRVYGESYPEVLLEALPDTAVWREELSYNEPLVQTYFRHPSYNDYPVVGVTWLQANDYCQWRTDRVNEMILIEKGILNQNPDQQDDDNFNTEAYLVGQYEGDVRKNLKNLDPKSDGERPVKFEDGILLPAYRLPTEAEWEYAALALKGNQAYAKDERISDRRLYPWNGNTMRNGQRGRFQGKMLANYKRGRGDYMGMAGQLNDNASVTAPVRSFMPNDYGLFNMAGNVSEWTMDVYRKMTGMTLSEVEDHTLNPFRGNVYKEKQLDENGQPVEKDSLGRLKYRFVEDDEVAGRDNYQRGSVMDYLDGDKESEVLYEVLYGTFRGSSLTNKARVIKGGSWSDRAYWLAPGARRWMNEDQASRTVGFRCAMTRMGSPSGNKFKGGNIFNRRTKRVRRRYK
ncbi:MAG: SUMF1/EgtB/PvdO family nonheme iron enzyme [Saprospiraceae bacterium]